MSRGSAWADAEVTALISIWGEAEIQEQLDGATRNKKFLISFMTWDFSRNAEQKSRI